MTEESKRTARQRKQRKEDLVYIHGGKCALCGYNKCIEALQFHHIRPELKKFGISTGNNRNWLDTIEESKKCILLCSNCHREVHSKIIKEDLVTSFVQERFEEIHNKRFPETKKNYCAICGKQIDIKATFCKECYDIIQRKVTRPTSEELEKIIKDNLGNFTMVGKLFGVSDNAVRKWCKNYGLPYHSADYKPSKLIKEPFEGYKKIVLLNENNEIDKIFHNGYEAAQWLKSIDKKITANDSSISTNIGRVCRGERKTCYKRHWIYLEDYKKDKDVL